MFQSYAFPEGLEDPAQHGSFKNIGILSSFVSSEILDLLKCWAECKPLPKEMYAPD